MNLVTSSAITLKNPLDGKVLVHLRGISGSTAHAMRGDLGETREDVSAACQRLKGKGLVRCEGAYWIATESGESK